MLKRKKLFNLFLIIFLYKYEDFIHSKNNNININTSRPLSPLLHIQFCMYTYETLNVHNINYKIVIICRQWGFAYINDVLGFRFVFFYLGTSSDLVFWLF